MRKNMLIEGWRFVPHSYACVNMWQCLELLKRPDLHLHHRDLPLYQPHWQPVRHLFGTEETAALEGIAPPPEGEVADLSLRIAFPYSFEPTEARRQLVFGTAEHGVVTPSMVTGNRSLVRALAASDATVITPSNWSRAGFLRSGAPPERVVVVPHGVDTAIFRPLPEADRDAVRRQLGWQDSLVLLGVGGMTGNKGIRYLLKAFAVVQKRLPHLRLCLKGLDPLYPSRQLLQESGDLLTAEESARVASALTYIGDSVSFADMARLYCASDLYVSPYLAEGFNLPVLEAAACGLPVICTAGGSTDDFVDEGFARKIRSKLIKNDEMLGVQPDLDHLISLLEETVENEAFRLDARRVAPSFVAAGFTWRHAVEKLLAVD